MQGDYNFDNKVDSLDFNALATNFGLTLSASAAARGAIVPEPGTVLLVALPLIQMRKRRR